MGCGAACVHHAGMTTPKSSQPAIALCATNALVLSEDGGAAPEWIHLLPNGEVSTNDARGPYQVRDMQALMAESLKAGERLVLDTNHSTDLAAPKGGDAPARGWIVELQHRSDGLWGKVEWTKEGRRMVEDKEYRGISPVIAHLKDKTIVAIRRASLLNQPNFKGLVALHQEESSMDFMKTIAKALGLDEDADEEKILAAITAALDAKNADMPEDMEEAAQAALSPVAAALGLDKGADTTAIVAGVANLKAGSDDTVTALQAQVTEATGQIVALQQESKQAKATAFIDGAIAEGRIGVKPQRQTYIEMHMENPQRTETLVKAMSKLDSISIKDRDVPGKVDGESDPSTIAMHATQYQKKMAESGVSIDFGAAVMAVQEGKHK